MDSWNESSRRYITIEPEFYVPKSEKWRLAPDNKKQGSGGPIDPWTGALLSEELRKFIDQGEALYSMALNNGVAPEQARLFLPAYGMYLIYRWSCSLQSIALFLNQRLAADAQHEITEYAKAVYQLIQPKFPVSITCLVNASNV
jgi:thymidylate synthase (FAD)